jgi:predicted NBD/HSP70 family sugar kinase
MRYYTGLDVSLKTTAICIVNQEGKVIFEDSIATDPATITSVIRETKLPI